MPHRVRTFMFANPSGMLGAEFVASEVKVNDSVAVPTELQIPAGTSVRDELTGKKYRQPIDEPKSNQDTPNASTGNSENTTNLDGLPGVTQFERDAPAPRPVMTPRDSSANENDQAVIH